MSNPITDGFTPLPSGMWMKNSDGSGPYIFSGTAMALSGSGGGGGGGGDASAANQTTQIARETAIAASTASTDAKTASQFSVRQIDVVTNSATLNAAVTVAIDGGIGEVVFDIAGLTASGATVTFEGTSNIGAATPVWRSVQSVVGGILSSTATTDSAYRISAGGRTAVRVRVSIVGTGNLTTSTTTSPAGCLVTLAQSIPAGSNAIGNVGAVAATNVSSTAYEKSHVLSATAGAKLFSLVGYNSGVDQFYQLHDASSLPADTAVPKAVIWVQANSNFAFDFGLRGRTFTTGIVVCSSSTGPTKTLGATADTWFDAQLG